MICRKRIVIPLLAGLLLAGCGECTFRLIQVSAPVTLTHASETISLVLSDQIADTNIAPSEFDRLFEVFEDASSGQTIDEVVWTVSQGFASPDAFLAVALRIPVVSGEVVVVRPDAFQGGGWGTGNGEFGTSFVHKAVVSFRYGGFVAERVNGTIEILDSSALRMELDLTFLSNTSSVSYRLRGEMSFRTSEMEQVCD